MRTVQLGTHFVLSRDLALEHPLFRVLQQVRVSTTHAHMTPPVTFVWAACFFCSPKSHLTAEEQWDTAAYGSRACVRAMSRECAMSALCFATVTTWLFSLTSPGASSALRAFLTTHWIGATQPHLRPIVLHPSNAILLRTTRWTPKKDS